MSDPTWRRSDLTAAGLGRGLIHGERPNHAVISPLGSSGFVATDANGTSLDIDVPAWCAARGRPAPTEADLWWVRGVEDV